jgi:predicted phosphodiesterase
MIRVLGILVIMALAIAPSSVIGSGITQQTEPVEKVWVQYTASGGAVRAIADDGICPELKLNRVVSPMQIRAEPNGDFNTYVCEAEISENTLAIEVNDQTFDILPTNPQRIAVVGDTGCRLKGGSAPDDGFQACNNSDEWPFAVIAQQVADWKPDLIIHVGDYVYRERACPDNNAGCAGSPYNSPGLRLDTWMADFFEPAQPLFAAAPIIFVRGNHEKCERAGSGYFRFLDPFPMRPCEDFSDPYALDFDELQLIIMDASESEDTDPSPDIVIEHFRNNFEQVNQLATGNTWLLSHQPIWAVQPNSDAGDDLDIINATFQQAISGNALPNIDFVLSGHVHLVEVLNFSGNRPPTVAIGNGGAKLLPPITTEVIGMELDGQTVTDAAIYSAHGFATFEQDFTSTWRVTLRDVDGEALNECVLQSRTATCQQ